jgi:hypothetical protein
LFRILALVQQAAIWIAREVFRKPGNRFPSALTDVGSPAGCGLFQPRKPLPKPGSIELVYGEHSHATLRAAGPADEPLSASMSGIGQGSIHDLDQRVIPGG